MGKTHTLEEGQIYAIPLSDGSFTIAKLINHHPLKGKLSVDTYAFFNYKFFSKKELEEKLIEIDLTKPFSIVTSSGAPWQYDWELIKIGNINSDRKILLEKLDKGGYFKAYSTDPSIFLEPYFGLFPWDGYFKDDYLDKHILPNAEMRDDIKYLKDFTTEELKELLPPNSPKLIKRLKEEE